MIYPCSFLWYRIGIELIKELWSKLWQLSIATVQLISFIIQHADLLAIVQLNFGWEEVRPDQSEAPCMGLKLNFLKLSLL